MDEFKDTVYGYPVKEICVFAYACREAGITNEELHDFVLNYSMGAQLAMKAAQESFQKTVQEVLKKEP